jgi:hypothetical protein
MTRFTVTWVNSATDELTVIWLASHEQSQITEAAHRIDVELSWDAPAKGRMVGEGLRCLHVGSLRAYFIVKEEDRIAEVVAVRQLP